MYIEQLILVSAASLWVINLAWGMKLQYSSSCKFHIMEFMGA